MKIPLVIYNGESREIIGEVRIDTDGNLTGVLYKKETVDKLREPGVLLYLKP
jgi:hypothetical protein